VPALHYKRGGRASRHDEGLARGGERLIAVPAVDDVGNHLAALDCLVQVSPREGNSLTLMEAMYVGVPIVTMRVGAVEEFERAAGERLFWSVPEDPTAHDRD
jgi:glycosyltransferase involved in cell wall biosynthesis